MFHDFFITVIILSVPLPFFHILIMCYSMRDQLPSALGALQSCISLHRVVRTGDKIMPVIFVVPDMWFAVQNSSMFSGTSNFMIEKSNFLFPITRLIFE